MTLGSGLECDIVICKHDILRLGYEVVRLERYFVSCINFVANGMLP